MVLSTSQQAVIGFTAVLFTFVVLPRMFGVGIGTGGATKESRFDRFNNRKVAPGPGAVRGQPVGMNAPGSAQTMENMQHMKTMMEQEMKNEKFKPNSNKGYVFTLMPLYAIGVGVFAAYKFLKIKSADGCQTQKSKVVKGTKKSAEAETQLNELEQRLGQTERMLNSILTQLDPLTNCVKTVAQEQKNEIMSQLQTIRYLMKKRGMDCPPVNIQESSCDRNLDDLIKSLAAHETLASDGGGRSCAASDTERSEHVSDDEYHKPNDGEATDEEEETDGQTLEECKREVKKGDGEEEEEDEEEEEEEEVEEEEEEEGRKGGEEEAHEDDLLPSVEDSDDETHIEDIGALQHGAEQQQPPCGLRRRAARPE